MFVNKHFKYLGRAYLIKYKVLKCDFLGTLFSRKDENVSRF